MLDDGIRIALFVLDAFVAVTAIGGGIALLSGLEGRRFSSDVLTSSRFDSFLLPGLLLAVVVGGFAALSAGAVLAGAALGGATSILAGAVLATFVGTEVVMLDDQPGLSVTELFYVAVGVAMVALGALTWVLG